VKRIILLNFLFSEAEKEAAEEEIRFREEEANSAKAKETGSLVKASAEYAYK
jgi:hypothetical protein